MIFEIPQNLSYHTEKTKKLQFYFPQNVFCFVNFLSTVAHARDPVHGSPHTGAHAREPILGSPYTEAHEREPMLGSPYTGARARDPCVGAHTREPMRGSPFTGAYARELTHETDESPCMHKKCDLWICLRRVSQTIHIFVLCTHQSL